MVPISSVVLFSVTYGSHMALHLGLGLLFLGGGNLTLGTGGVLPRAAAAAAAAAAGEDETREKGK